ncbi:MAG: bifunctional 4-hydroxy-2-oxoglutarate aldolase/2-dehydro-3-deoxy-phosphogluconate aldolase [Chloroflexota bacterium]
MLGRYAQIEQAGLIAVVRAERSDHAVSIAGALLKGGVRAIELTFTIPGASEALAEVRSVYGTSVILGAGSIRECSQVDLAVRAGVDFLVTSHLRADVLAAMLDTGLPIAPGVFTPTEVAQALDAGAEAVKLFPASTAGPRHLRALRGPFPQLRVIPTGGIDRPDLRAWFEAGAMAIGVGSELVPPSSVRTGQWDEITRRAERFALAADEARAPLHNSGVV